VKADGYCACGPSGARWTISIRVPQEMDCEYVWTAHEPAAQKAGLQQEIIDIVKFRRPLTKLGQKEAVIAQLGRDAIGKHNVGSDTFARAVKLFGNQGVVNIVSLIRATARSHFSSE